LKIALFLLGLTLMQSGVAFAEEAPVRLYSAGSLTVAMTEMAQAFTAAGGPAVTSVFGASGLLRERIERGKAKPARLATAQFAFFVVSMQGQEILAQHGSTPVAAP
jgi:ABC-type molybdate transport system substrate-binding protein